MLRTAWFCSKLSKVSEIKKVLASNGLNPEVYTIVHKPVKHEYGNYYITLDRNNLLQEERKFVDYMHSNKDFYFIEWVRK